MKTSFFGYTKAPIALLLGSFLVPFFASAEIFTLSPHVIDVKGRAREISHYGITIQNKTEAVRTVFVWAVDVDQEKGDLSTKDMSGVNENTVAESPSRWVEISRSNQILPKEEQTIPMQIQIPGQVKPGMYHVSLKFASAESQSVAMRCTDCIEEVALNIQVTEDIREKLQLFSFTAAKNIFVKPEADFNFSVENTGNRAVVPSGKIRIFNNSGKEVGLVDINNEGKQIDPKSKELLAATWAANGKFGKYKAMLDVSYGQRGSMQDVVYFWVIPWTKFFGFLTTLALVAILIVLFLRSRTMSQPAYVYEEYSAKNDFDTEELNALSRTSSITRIESKNAKQPYVQLSEGRQRQNGVGLTEVSLPARTRTVPPTDFAVQLSTKKVAHSEDHIVRLK